MTTLTLEPRRQLSPNEAMAVRDLKAAADAIAHGATLTGLALAGDAIWGLAQERNEIDGSIRLGPDERQIAKDPERTGNATMLLGAAQVILDLAGFAPWRSVRAYRTRQSK